jgi:hypothetical protein
MALKEFSGWESNQVTQPVDTYFTDGDIPTHTNVDLNHVCHQVLQNLTYFFICC